MKNPSGSNSDSECSSSAKSTVSSGKNTDERAITCAVVSRDNVLAKVSRSLIIVLQRRFLILRVAIVKIQRSLLMGAVSLKMKS